MPIYEYRCSSCGHELEALQKLAEAPLLACPSCHADALVKLVSASAFQLKGSGWYATDFKNSGARPAAKTTEPASKADTASSTDPKPAGEAKPATESKPSGEKKAAPPAQG